MRFWTVALISFLASGCFSQRAIVVGGLEDYIRIPKDSKITEVPVPTDESKKYTIVTQKDGVWLSLDAWNRVEKSK